MTCFFFLGRESATKRARWKYNTIHTHTGRVKVKAFRRVFDSPLIFVFLLFPRDGQRRQSSSD